jgi:hypothetical protein
MRSLMPASGSDDDRHVICDLIGWQHRAQTEPLGTLGNRAAAELNHLADTLDELNQLLREPPCSCGCTQDAIIDAVVQVMRAGTSAAICTLGLSHRSRDGLSLVSVPSPSVN